MTCDAAQKNPKVDTRGNGAAFTYSHSHEAYIVGVCKNRDGTAVVEGNIELAWQLIHIARVNNVGLHRFDERSYINKPVWVDAGNGRCSDVADVVGSRAMRSKAKCSDTVEDAYDIAWLKFTNLQIASGSEIRAAGAIRFGKLRQPAELMRRKNSSGNTKAKHERVLRRRYVEETEILKAEAIFVGGSLVPTAVLKNRVPDGKRVLFMLPALFA